MTCPQFILLAKLSKPEAFGYYMTPSVSLCTQVCGFCCWSSCWTTESFCLVNGKFPVCFLQSLFFFLTWRNVKSNESIPELLSTPFRTRREKVASSDCCSRISESISHKGVWMREVLGLRCGEVCIWGLHVTTVVRGDKCVSYRNQAALPILKWIMNWHLIMSSSPPSCHPLPSS